MKKFNFLRIFSFIFITFFTGSVFSTPLSDWCKQELNKVAKTCVIDSNSKSIFVLLLKSNNYPDLNSKFKEYAQEKRTYLLLEKQSGFKIDIAKRSLTQLFNELKMVAESAKNDYLNSQKKIFDSFKKPANKNFVQPQVNSTKIEQNNIKPTIEKIVKKEPTKVSNHTIQKVGQKKSGPNKLVKKTVKMTSSIQNKTVVNKNKIVEKKNGNNSGLKQYAPISTLGLLVGKDLLALDKGIYLYKNGMLSTNSKIDNNVVGQQILYSGKSDKGVKYFCISGPSQQGAQCGVNSFSNAKSIINGCINLVSESFLEFLQNSLYGAKYENKTDKVRQNVLFSRTKQMENIEKISSGLDVTTSKNFIEVTGLDKYYGTCNQLTFDEMMYLNGNKTRKLYNGFGCSILVLQHEQNRTVYSAEDILKSKELVKIKQSLLFETGLEVICINTGGHWVTMVLYLIENFQKQKVVGPPIVIDSIGFIDEKINYYEWFIEPIYKFMTK